MLLHHPLFSSILFVLLYFINYLLFLSFHCIFLPLIIYYYLLSISTSSHYSSWALLALNNFHILALTVGANLMIYFIISVVFTLFAFSFSIPSAFSIFISLDLILIIVEVLFIISNLEVVLEAFYSYERWQKVDYFQ